MMRMPRRFLHGVVLLFLSRLHLGGAEEGSCQVDQDGNAVCEAIYTDKVDHVPISQKCQDQEEDCPLWVRQGECTNRNSIRNMFQVCPKSCGICKEFDTSEVVPQQQQQQQQQQVELVELECHDNDEMCEPWAQRGECDGNPTFMHANCAKSCHVCPQQKQKHQHQQKHSVRKFECHDTNPECPVWAQQGDCSQKERLRYMNVHCRKSCELCANQVPSNPHLQLLERLQGVDLGTPQTLEHENYSTLQFQPEQVHLHIEMSRRYLETTRPGDHPNSNGIGIGMDLMCKNFHEMCTLWALKGECEVNPNYMKKTCAPACQSCDYLTIEGRCPLDPDAPNAWGPGDLNRMFTKLTSEPYLSQYAVEILSQPPHPWIITMQNVVNHTQADRLIELGAIVGYNRSSDVGELRPDGTYQVDWNSGRTSTNAWCDEKCHQDDMVQSVMHRLSNVTDIPEINSEHLQLLRYEPGQYYHVHHDYIRHHIRRQQGPRILTVFLYLNDVEEGGGTNFDQYNITVLPKRGQVLLWPSVYDDDPNKKDERTSHQALPVAKGIKYGSNAWFHLRDYKTAHKNQCV